MNETKSNNSEDQDLVNALPRNQKKMPKHKPSYQEEVPVQNEDYDEDNEDYDDGDEEDYNEPPNKKQKKEKSGKSNSSLKIAIMAVITIALVAAAGFMIINKMKPGAAKSPKGQPVATLKEPALSEAPLTSEAPLLDPTPIVADVPTEQLNLNQSADQLAVNKQYIDAGLKYAMQRMFGMINIKNGPESLTLTHAVPSVKLDGSVFVKVEGLSADLTAMTESGFEEVTAFNDINVQDKIMTSPKFNTANVSKYKITYAVVNGKDVTSETFNPIMIYEVEVNVNELHNSSLTITEVTSSPAQVITSAFDASSMFSK